MSGTHCAERINYRFFLALLFSQKWCCFLNGGRPVIYREMGIELTFKELSGHFTATIIQNLKSKAIEIQEAYIQFFGNLTKTAKHDSHLIYSLCSKSFLVMGKTAPFYHKSKKERKRTMQAQNKGLGMAAAQHFIPFCVYVC